MNERARLLTLVLVLPLGACAAEATDPTSVTAPAVCESNPEPKRIAVNGIQANGVQMNGIQSNGIQTNGVEINGVQMNRIALNGVEDGRIAVNGTELTGSVLRGVRLERGELVTDRARGEAFVGARLPALLSDGRTIELRVTSFERKDALAFYGLAFEGQSLCADGETGLFLPGTWDATGAHHDSASTVTFSCARGVIAKCATWGYAPWDVGTSLHQTCTRMARADYCGTGVSYTKNGTPIDMMDVRGVQTAANEPGFLFEAGWNEGGAVCVSRPRYDARSSNGERIAPSCFRALPSCASLEDARAHGATIANASRPQTRVFCD